MRVSTSSKLMITKTLGKFDHHQTVFFKIVKNQDKCCKGIGVMIITELKKIFLNSPLLIKKNDLLFKRKLPK